MTINPMRPSSVDIRLFSAVEMDITFMLGSNSATDILMFLENFTAASEVFLNIQFPSGASSMLTIMPITFNSRVVLGMRSSYFIFGVLGPAVQVLSALTPKTYNSLPLGQVKPNGWLTDQLNLQVNGLAGNEHVFYSWVANSDWTGGGPYWFNGVVPTAFASGSATLINRTQYFLDYVLSHQEASTGWIGPEVNTSRPRYLWARYIFMLGATQLVEADPTRLNETLTALYKFIPEAYSMLQNGQGLNDGGWGAIRWQEFALSLQWLYDNHPNGNEALLLNTMNAAKSTGGDWNSIFATGNFPTTAVTDLQQKWHGVNIAEGLHAAAVSYRMTGSTTDRAAIDEAWANLFTYHGRPSGVFGADEFLAGLEANRGSELCLVVEQMFSGSYVFQVIGNTSYAERTERVAYNALPATLTPTMWSHQYLQQQNQIGSRNMNPDPFPGDGSYSNVFGLEPNYPCCAVNHPQGFGKFISNAFVTTPNQSSLMQVYLGPFTVSTTLANSNAVKVTVTTQYPFSDIIQTTITSTSAFTYLVRIPSWVVGGTIQIGSAAAVALTPSAGVQSVSVPAGGVSFTLNLPAAITTESRPHGSVAVHRGPLHYALMIKHTDTQLSSNSALFVQPQPLAADYELDASSSWAYAIDPKSLYFHGSSASPSAALPTPIFADGAPPLTISAIGCSVNWTTGGTTWANNPPEYPLCTSGSVNLTLVPYGATRLRISEFPVVSLLI
ncbi:hypothetical protein DL93DRAFT_2167719 [Clavulina sp. PMI_390]|nr:hypothetical protein DL93DRAFT_2167719 [Clavulina sp. PMI_390]